jgi:hypothetical protein
LLPEAPGCRTSPGNDIQYKYREGECWKFHQSCCSSTQSVRVASMHPFENAWIPFCSVVFQYP